MLPTQLPKPLSSLACGCRDAFDRAVLASSRATSQLSRILLKSVSFDGDSGSLTGFSSPSSFRCSSSLILVWSSWLWRIASSSCWASRILSAASEARASSASTSCLMSSEFAPRLGLPPSSLGTVEPLPLNSSSCCRRASLSCSMAAARASVAFAPALTSSSCLCTSSLSRRRDEVRSSVAVAPERTFSSSLWSTALSFSMATNRSCSLAWISACSF
mmetsp:Transcript_28002/g.63384  ORF Transcript_28002/g.63384 Transcript_28002/m.63384 type:complete len:217 (-) Transcript_28002:1233-1883(-)